MTGRAITYLLLTAVGIAILCVGGLAGLTSAAAACTPPVTASATAGPAMVAGYDPEQLSNATTIVTVGTGRGIPVRGLVIAVATAIQESSLRNLGDLGPGNDHDSLGLFQQRPSQGWGTPEQIMDPVYASNKFFDKLLTINGWEKMPLTQAAQAVQVSALPERYAAHEADATALVALAAGAYGGCIGGDGTPGAGEALPAGLTFPPDAPLQAVIAIWWALQQRGTPYHFAGSCTEPHGADPDKQCDCSSLVQQAYKHAGISLPRVTFDQQHSGVAVAGVNDLRPGDLIFIPGSDGTIDQPGHVGLYIGQGLLVQAPHTGDVVKISKVWNPVAKIRRVVTWPPDGSP